MNLVSEGSDLQPWSGGVEAPWIERSSVPAGEGLRRLYDEYRRREASNLLSLIPPEAVRPLYRLAREHASGRGGGVPDDPLATLVDFVETELLPLPPFEVWLSDFRANRAAHLAGIDADPRAEDPRAPVTVDVRSFRYLNREWYAGLSLFRRPDGWTGFLAFSGEDGRTEARTADIFREDDPESIRDRFRGFGVDSLQAFLRSSLP